MAPRGREEEDVSEKPERASAGTRWSPTDLWPALAALVTLGLIAPQDVRRVTVLLVQAAAGHGILLAKTALADMFLCTVLTWNQWPDPVPGHPRHGKLAEWIFQATVAVAFLATAALTIVGLVWLVQILLPELGSPWPFGFAAWIFMFLVLAEDQRGPVLRLPRGLVHIIWYFTLSLIPVGTYLLLAGQASHPW